MFRGQYLTVHLALDCTAFHSDIPKELKSSKSVSAVVVVVGHGGHVVDVAAVGNGNVDFGFPCRISKQHWVLNTELTADPGSVRRKNCFFEPLKNMNMWSFTHKQKLKCNDLLPISST